MHDFPVPWRIRPNGRCWSGLGLTIIVATSASCGGGSPAPGDTEVGSTSDPVVTDIIPTSIRCDRGSPKPSWCISSPPATVHRADDRQRFAIDGQWMASEYAGGTELPYTNWQVKAGGTIAVKVWRWKPWIDTSAGAVQLGSGNHLQVYLRDIPFYAKDTGELCIFMDNNRFTGTTVQATAEDRVYCVDMFEGTNHKVYRPSYWNGGNGSVALWPVREFFSVHTNHCSADPSTNAVLRCSAELDIPLPDSAFEKPDPTLEPGIGLAAVGLRRDAWPRASMPEACTLAYGGGPIPMPWDDRRRALTLLFGPPQGFAKRYMSWNIRRSSIGKLAGPFSAVDDADVGRFLAGDGPWAGSPNDIVAVQEGWNLKMMDRVLQAANDWRRSVGAPEFRAYGPVDFQLSTFRQVVDAVAGAFIGNEGTTGGLWVFSPLPAGGSSFHSFEACKGEDCFKAKGVQWVRLMLNPPSSQNMDKKCLEARHESCPPPPSGGEYIDVFNVHMQSSNPELCKYDNLKGDIKAALAALVVEPEAVPALLILKQLAEKDWNCGMPDAEVRARQLEEIRAFIENHAVNPATGLHDRPAIIMGDFNIDGRNLGSEYVRMLKTLGVWSRGGLDAPPTDLINPWPYDFDWDIDHGDIARERKEIDWSSGVCSGTFIGETGGTAVNACGYASDWNGSARYDYILVRPPVLPDDPSYGATSWVAAKAAGDDPGVWFSQFPSFGSYGGPPERLSDHKPVMATIQHVKLAYPPLYHATWNHSVTFRVLSEDASDHGDCKWCGPVDPYGVVSALRLHNGQNEWRAYQAQTSECENAAVNSWPADACMADWSYGDTEIFGEDAVHTFFAALWDNDDTSHDDAMYTFSGGEWPQQAIEWDPGWVRMRGFRDPNRSFEWIPDWPLHDNDPIAQQTGSSPTNTTLLCSFAELPPGQQQ